MLAGGSPTDAASLRPHTGRGRRAVLQVNRAPGEGAATPTRATVRKRPSIGVEKQQVAKHWIQKNVIVSKTYNRGCKFPQRHGTVCGMRLGLFTADQVCSLCGISSRQLGYWNRTGFFKPRLAEGERRPFNRIYSFRDVVGLRTIGRLRNRYNVPLADLRRISDELKSTPDTDWSKLVFFEDPIAEERKSEKSRHGRVYFRHPQSGEVVASSPLNQRPLFEMREVIQNVERSLSRLNRRKPKQIGKIDQNRYVVRNEPVIAGTRVPTAAIYRLHQAGYSAQAIIKEFPRLKLADVEAAIKHARLRVAI